MLTLYRGFVGRRFQKKKYCRIHHANVSAILEAIFNVMRLIFETMRQRNATIVSTHIIYGQHNSDSALHHTIVGIIWLAVVAICSK